MRRSVSKSSTSRNAQLKHVQIELRWANEMVCHIENAHQLCRRFCYWLFDHFMTLLISGFCTQNSCDWAKRLCLHSLLLFLHLDLNHITKSHLDITKANKMAYCSTFPLLPWYPNHFPQLCCCKITLSPHSHPRCRSPTISSIVPVATQTWSRTYRHHNRRSSESHTWLSALWFFHPKISGIDDLQV